MAPSPAPTGPTGRLLVSIGNSRTASASLAPDGRLSGILHVPHGDGDPLAGFDGAGPIHLVSVVEDRAKALVSDLRSAGREVIWWGFDREIPVRHPYRAPEKPGADRLVAALAAHRRTGGACVVVDAGTAATVDAVAQDGTFLGGAIGPGFRTLRAGLVANAPALAARGADRPDYPARSTGDAVNLGILAAFAGMLRGLVADALGILGDVPVFVTGGDAELAAGALQRHNPVVVPALVLEGLAELARSST